MAERLRKAVGRANDLLPKSMEQTVHCEWQNRGGYYDHQEISRPVEMYDLNAAVNDPFMTTVQRTRLLINEVEAHPDKYDRAIVVRLQNRDGQVAYAIADELLRSRGFDDREIEWISETVAKNLVLAYNEHYVR